MTTTDLDDRARTVLNLALAGHGGDEIAMLIDMPPAWVKTTLGDHVRAGRLRAVAGGLYGPPVERNGRGMGAEEHGAG